MKKNVVIFIDTIAPKNKLQLDILHDLGYTPICFITFKKENTDLFFKKGGRQEILQPGLMGRLKQIYRFFKSEKKNIHHVEIYPGGRFSFIYLLFTKFFGVKSICAERGDLLYYNKQGYNMFVKASMWCCYKFSNLVWYREFYMKPMLEKIRASGLFFMHNAIKVEDFVAIDFHQRDIDFLWLNRVIPERKSKWFLDVLSSDKYQDSSNVLVGIQKNTTFNIEVDYVYKHTPKNLRLVEYSAEPEAYFKRAKYFVLPADVVFANHALLEAMSYGVVPLVSNVGGAERIVESEVHGFLFEHNFSAFKTAMDTALHLPQITYERYSTNSRKKIETDFSESHYAEKLNELYHLLD